MFIHSMEEISRREYYNFRLFGDGSESPLRIHLRNRGREFTHAIPIVPLFKDPCFSRNYVFRQGKLPALNRHDQ